MTYYEKLIDKLKNNKLIAIFLVAFVILTGILQMFDMWSKLPFNKKSDCNEESIELILSTSFRKALTMQFFARSVSPREFSNSYKKIQSSIEDCRLVYQKEIIKIKNDCSKELYEHVKNSYDYLYDVEGQLLKIEPYILKASTEPLSIKEDSIYKFSILEIEENRINFILQLRKISEESKVKMPSISDFNEYPEIADKVESKTFLYGIHISDEMTDKQIIQEFEDFKKKYTIRILKRIEYRKNYH